MADIASLRWEIAAEEALIAEYRRKLAELPLGERAKQADLIFESMRRVSSLMEELQAKQRQSRDQKEITPMTDTLSEREKELVEAVRSWHGDGIWRLKDGNMVNDSWARLSAALKAYDPKPEPVPVIPEWEDFAKGHARYNYIHEDKVYVGFEPVSRESYEAIRKATARMPD